MKTEQPAIYVVPTELSRSDGFLDAAALLGTGLAVWWLALKGVPIWAFVPVLAVLAVFVLTGEPAGDVAFIGAVAAGLRSKLGLRRAHEWALAWCHYTRVRTWPDLKDWSKTKWQNSRLRSRIATLTHSRAWQRTISASHTSMQRHWSMRPCWLLRGRLALAGRLSSAVGREQPQPE